MWGNKHKQEFLLGVLKATARTLKPLRMIGGMSRDYLGIGICYFLHSLISMIKREFHSNFSQPIIVKFLTKKA